MKNLLCILIVLLPLLSFSQVNPELEHRYLVTNRPIFSYYNAGFKTYDFTNSEINGKLKEALAFRTKANNKTSVGVMCLIAGAGLMTLGATYHTKPGIEGLLDFTKPVLLTAGTIPLIISIPSFNVAHKNKVKLQSKMQEAGTLLIR